MPPRATQIGGLWRKAQALRQDAGLIKKHSRMNVLQPCHMPCSVDDGNETVGVVQQGLERVATCGVARA